MAQWKGLVRIAVLLAALGACARSSSPPHGIDGESHFLRACEDGCGDALSCVDQVCTRSCEDDDACQQLSSLASCRDGEGVDASAVVDEPYCDVSCDEQDDCRQLGEGFVCADSQCRQKADGGGGFGDPCMDGSDCTSGVCEGPGCDGVTPGTCTGVGDAGQSCEAVLQEYCGCDGTTFTGGGFYLDAPDRRCAGRRYARTGSCSQDGGTDGGLPEGASCGPDDECLSGVCEGEGCGDAAGTCVATATPRTCTDDAVQYCGCDGVTFTSSGSCPGRLYAHRGPC